MDNMKQEVLKIHEFDHRHMSRPIKHFSNSGFLEFLYWEQNLRYSYRMSHQKKLSTETLMKDTNV